MQNKKYIKIEVPNYTNIYIAEEYKNIDFNKVLEKEIYVEIEGTKSFKCTEIYEVGYKEEHEYDDCELLYETEIKKGRTLADIFEKIENKIEYDTMYIEQNSIIVKKENFELVDIYIDTLKID